MAISHSGCHVTTRASSHVRSRAVSNFHRGRDEFKVTKNSSLLFYDKVKESGDCTPSRWYKMNERTDRDSDAVAAETVSRLCYWLISLILTSGTHCLID